MIKKKKICLVVSSEMTIKTFLLDHLKLLCIEYDVFIVAGTNCQYLHNDYKLDISVIKIPINRNINIGRDFLSLIRLLLVFKKNKFESKIAKKVFGYSIFYLFLIFLLILIDHSF